MPRVKKDRVFHVITIHENHDGRNELCVDSMSEPELLAWIANADSSYLIFEGTEIKPQTHVTLEAVDTPTQQPADKPKRKRRTKAEMEAARVPPKVANGAGEKKEERAS